MPLKIALLGPSQVGKTTLLHRIVSGTIPDTTKPTVGAAHGSLRYRTRDLEIWDTAGQERFKSIAPAVYRNAPVIFVVFAVNDPSTLAETEFWTNQVRADAKDLKLLVLLGNKIDTKSGGFECISSEAASAKAEILGSVYMEGSAKTGEGLAELLDFVVDQTSSLSDSDCARLNPEEDLALESGFNCC
jgi:small GTP-binding protein